MGEDIAGDRAAEIEDPDRRRTREGEVVQIEGPDDRKVVGPEMHLPVFDFVDDAPPCVAGLGHLGESVEGVGRGVEGRVVREGPHP